MSVGWEVGLMYSKGRVFLKQAFSNFIKFLTPWVYSQLISYMFRYIRQLANTSTWVLTIVNLSHNNDQTNDQEFPVLPR